MGFLYFLSLFYFGGWWGREREREREGERESQAGSALSPWSPTRAHKPWDREWPEPKSGVGHLTDWATQAPRFFFSFVFLRNLCLSWSIDFLLFSFRSYVIFIFTLSLWSIWSVRVKSFSPLQGYLVVWEPFVEKTVLPLLTSLGPWSKSIDCRCLELFPGTLFCSIDLSVYPSTSTYRHTVLTTTAF